MVQKLTIKPTTRARGVKPKTKKAKSGRPKSDHRAVQASDEVSQAATKAIDQPLAGGPLAGPLTWVVLAVIGVVFAWAYWPVLEKLVDSWSRIADYSHGYLVAPIALTMLWVRRAELAEKKQNDRPSGLVVLVAALMLILMAAALRWVAAKYYFDAFAGWSIPFWFAGVVLLLYGKRTLVWALPAIVFLFFMVPLPYAIETAVARPLQIASAQISCFIFQSMLLPAALEGNTILLGDYTLEVARACSGLRITLGVAALAFAFGVLFQRTMMSNVLMAVAILPIAVFANSLRIVITGLLYRLGYSESFMSLGHDGAGFLMLPIAAFMFLGLIWYLDRLFPQVEVLNSSSLVKQQVRSG